jgi:hypothetical protein
MPERCAGGEELCLGDAAPGTPSPAQPAGQAPSRELLDALHLRLVSGDNTATSEVANLVLGPVVQGLRRRAGALLQGFGRTVREDLIVEAAEDAYLSYVKRPQQYAPQKAPGGLLRYLIMSAHGDLLNALPSAARHRHVAPLSLVELQAQARNTRLTLVGGAAGDLGNPDERLDAQARAAELDAQLAAQEALMETEAERKVLRHMAVGERSTTVFAHDLGLATLPPVEQQREVKRVKDKIKKRLERARKRGGDA